MSRDWTASFISGAADGDLSIVLAAYLAAVDRGEEPDRAALIAQHPHLADELRAFFDSQDRLENIAEPLRVHNQAEATALAYELLEEINRGGMGVVLRCRDRTLDRDLAIKVLLENFRDQPDMVRRFIEEARITGQLQHPFVVPVHKLGTLPDGRPYFAMKLVRGRTLAELLRERESLTHELGRFLKVFEQVCQTVAYAHSKGVIHRDLKPSNVMVGAFGEVQVMDWGLAKVLDGPLRELAAGDEPGAVGYRAEPEQTQAGAVLGTYAYMPPEQANGNLDQVSRRSDVFGLGAMLCEILTGMPPYAGEQSAVRDQARAGDIATALTRLEGCSAEGELIELARTCMALLPGDRPADGAAVADAMARYFAAVQERMQAAQMARVKAETEAVEERKRVVLAEAKAEAEVKRSKAERRRRRANGLMAASLMLLLAAGAGFMFWYQADRAARRSVTERDVAAALAEVRLRHEEGVKQADYPERWQLTLNGARDALKRAENALALGEPVAALTEELARARALLDQDERDRTFFLTLERLWLEAGSFSAEDVRGPRDAGMLLQAFREYGLDIDRLDAKEAARRIRQHPHRSRIAEEVNLVAIMTADFAGKRPRMRERPNKNEVRVIIPDWSRAERFTRILDEVDGDRNAFGTRWRAARTKQDLPALVEMAQSVKVDQLSPRSASSLAHDLIAMRAFSEARVLLGKALEQHPADYWLNQVMGTVCASAAAAEQGGSLDDAIRYFTAALAVRGNNAPSQIYLSVLFKMRGQDTEAFRAAQAAIAADPQSAPAHHHLGRLYYDSKDWVNAHKSFAKAAELDHVSPLPHDSLGQVYAAQRDYDQAIKHYRIALKREPTFAAVHVNLGTALAALGDLKAALAEYRKAIELLPHYAMAHYNLGVSLSEKRDIDGALRCFQDALDCDPNYVAALNALGKLHLYFRRDPESAIKYYQRVVEIYPNLPQSHFQMSDLFQALGRNNQAEASLRKVIELDAKYPEAHARLGIILAGRGDWDNAISHYRIALQNNNEAPDKQAAVQDYLGIALFNKGNLEEALTYERKALAHDPKNALYHHNLGVVQKGMGNMDDAAQSFRTAIELAPQAALFHFRLASVLLEKRQLDAGIAGAQKALELDPNFLDAYHILAQAQYDKHEFEAGLATARKGFALADTFHPAATVLRTDIELGQIFLKADENLDAVIRGDVKASAGEMLTLAMICANKRHKYLSAYRLFADAFAQAPAMAENLEGSCRYFAACFAVRAANGEGDEAAKLDDAEKQRLRKQAQDWLVAELANWKRAYRYVPVLKQGIYRHRVQLWLTEAGLDAVRDPQKLEQLPKAEREAWTRFWGDVNSFVSNNAVASQPGPDLAKLRKLARFPSISRSFYINFENTSRTGRGTLIDPAREIATLQAQLNGTIADADIYLKQIRYFGDLKQKDKITEAAEKAEKLLRPYKDTNDPAHAQHLADYTRAHIHLHTDRWQDHEKWTRRVIELDPKNWGAWQAVGNWCLYRAEIAILGGRIPDSGDQEAIDTLSAGKVPAQVVGEVEKLLDEARKCYDRAKELAPENENQWERRIAHLLMETNWINALRVARGKTPLPRDTSTVSPFTTASYNVTRFSMDAMPDLLAECREAAEKCPEHIGLQAFGVLGLLPRLKARLQDANKERRQSLLTPQETDFLEKTIARLEKIASKSAPEAATYCDSIIGYVYLQIAVLDDMEKLIGKAEPYFRRVVAAEPKNGDAADVLEFVLTEQGRAEAAVEVARKRLENNPTLRNRYLLARALHHAGQIAAAQQELDAALKADPRDPYLLAGRAVLHLREDAGADELAEAGKLLQHARDCLLPDHSKELCNDIDFVMAIHHALTDRPVLARITFQNLSAEHPQDATYTDALQALGQ